MWHKAFRGDLPEDYVELLTENGTLEVLAMSNDDEYFVTRRNLNKDYNLFTWDTPKHVKAWIEIEPYTN